jgi:hypothetical protein
MLFISALRAKLLKDQFHTHLLWQLCRQTRSSNKDGLKAWHRAQGWHLVEINNTISQQDAHVFSAHKKTLGRQEQLQAIRTPQYLSNNHASKNPTIPIKKCVHKYRYNCHLLLFRRMERYKKNIVISTNNPVHSATQDAGRITVTFHLHL